MSNDHTPRRDFLRISGASLAGAALHSRPAEAQTPPPAPNAGIFDVKFFGATGDGKTIDTPAINRAIEAAASAGGGTVRFPSGNYLCYSIRLKSNVALSLDQNAVIIAAQPANEPATDPSDSTSGSGTYDLAEPNTSWDAYQDYGHNHWHNSLLWGEDIHDFSITGPGLIYGKGLSFGAGPGRPPIAGQEGTGPAPANGASALGGEHAPSAPPVRRFPARGDYPMYQAEQPGVGNKSIALKNCRNAIFRDFSLLKGGHFGFLLTGVDNLTIDNLKIDTNRDGMDIDCCRNVRVTNCTVNSPWDDGICPKSSYALGYARSTENLTIANCYVTGAYELGTVLDGTWKLNARQTGTGRIKCGTESNGGFKGITITNCVFERCLGLALETEDGAICEDITVSNIAMRHVRGAPFFFRLGARLRGPAGTEPGKLRRILLSNITSSGAGQLPSILAGIPSQVVEDIKIHDLYLEQIGGAVPAMAAIYPPEEAARYPEPNMFGDLPASGVFLRHVRNVGVSNVEIATRSPDGRPAFWLEDVDGADFFRVRVPKGAPAFDLRKVKNFRSFGSQFLQDVVIESVEGQRQIQGNG